MPKNNKKFRKQFKYNGKVYEVYGDTLEEVITKKALKLKELEDNVIIYNSNTTVQEWGDKAVDVYKSHLVDKSLRAYKDMLKRVYKVIGNLPLSKVRKAQCQEVLNSVAGMSTFSIRFTNQGLNFIFKTAIANGLIGYNPADNLILPQGFANKRRSLTDEERTAFYKALKVVPNFGLYQFCLECGCRPSEAAGIMRMDLEEIDGEYLLHIRGTKTSNSDRYVPCPEALYKKYKKGSPFEYLFTTSGNLKYDENALKRLRDRLYREMNIALGCRVYRNQIFPPYPLAPDFVPYMFRHTYCTDLCRKGVDVRIASKLMGHSTIEITNNIYTHVDQSDIIKVSKQLREISL